MKKEAETNQRLKYPHIKTNNTNLASCNLTGVNKKGKRQEVERWMTENDIEVLAAQETMMKHNQKETRPQYTWFSAPRKVKRNKNIYKKKQKKLFKK